MANLDQAEANRLLNAKLGLVAYLAVTAPIMLRLMGTNGTATSNGTQITGGSYAAQSLTAALGTAAAGTVTTTSAITYTLMPAGTVNGVEEWDSAGTPRRLSQDPLTVAKTLNAGDTLTIPAGSFTDSMA